MHSMSYCDLATTLFRNRFIVPDLCSLSLWESQLTGGSDVGMAGLGGFPELKLVSNPVLSNFQ